MNESFEMVVPFDRDTADFVLGVEVGILHQRLTTEPLPVTAVLHAANAEMSLRLAEAHATSARSEELGDDWLAVTFGS